MITEAEKKSAADRAELRHYRAEAAGRTYWCSPGIVCDPCHKVEGLMAMSSLTSIEVTSTNSAPSTAASRPERPMRGRRAMFHMKPSCSVVVNPAQRMARDDTDPGWVEKICERDGCNNQAQPSHLCPFDQELGDGDKSCICCDVCEDRCGQDI